MNHKKIKRIKNKYGLKTSIRTINPYKSIKRKTEEHCVFNNILNRQFNQNIPGSVFGTDISYIPFNNSFVYLSVVKDIASREIVVWEVSKNIQMNIVLNTVKKLKDEVGDLNNALLHSDQGFHYTNPQYIHRLKDLGITQSMSRLGNCLDNAPTESFFGHFKAECELDNCDTFEDLSSKIDDFMRYYNTDRPPWNLQKMTPVKYRDHLLKNLAK